LSVVRDVNIVTHTLPVNKGIHGMDFRAATDRLMERGVPARKVAEALGLRPNTVRAMRLAAESEHRRSPPDGWEPVLARLARERGGELLELAEELER
jgi:hypothetical protein